jgi:trimeric autotransporter adhesin
MKGILPSFRVILTAVWFGLLSNAQAVVPAPDGGYPGGNTAEGQSALFSLTTGGFNTAIGYFSLRSNATGQFNTAIGAGALFVNNADQNTATGAGALLSNTGVRNTANGFEALSNNITGDDNTANGVNALFSNISGSSNTATGFNALQQNTTGVQNTASGVSALFSNTTADSNTAIGFEALFSNINGTKNTAVGFEALQDNIAGNFNTAIGFQALQSNTNGANTAIGSGALASNTSGSFNTALGNGAGTSVTTASNVICIATNGSNVNGSCFIGNIRGVTTAQNNAIPVLIDSAGQLGTMSSSRRFKKEIKPMDKASEAILALKPVTFHYKSDNANRPEFGLIAEDVEKVNPDLVIYDADGKPYTVRYDAVNAMLLNEFLKAHRKIDEQQATIAQLKNEMETVLARLK